MNRARTVVLVPSEASVDAVREEIERCGSFEVVGVERDVGRLVAHVRRSGPDVIALDESFKHALPELQRAIGGPTAPRLMLTRYEAPPPTPRAQSGGSFDLVAIAASTGGPRAVEKVLAGLPRSPPVLIVQHMPAGFTTRFAERLATATGRDVREAYDGAPLKPGSAFVAPGNHHIRVARAGDRLVVRLVDGPRVHHQRPAADVLFHSVAKVLGGRAIGIILTGLGRDGAAGMRAMREAGAYTIAESEASCVAFGMPRAAIEEDAAVDVFALGDVAPAVVQALAPRSASGLRASRASR
jgi:two-component system chemotaxis response regulator CheB